MTTQPVPDDDRGTTAETAPPPEESGPPPGGDDVRVGPDRSDEPEAGATEPAD